MTDTYCIADYDVYLADDKAMMSNNDDDGYATFFSNR